MHDYTDHSTSNCFTADIKSLPALPNPARNRVTSAPRSLPRVKCSAAITTITSSTEQSPSHSCHHFEMPQPHRCLVAADPLRLSQCIPRHQFAMPRGSTSKQFTTPLLGLPIQPPVQSEDTTEEDLSNGDVPLIQHCLAGPPELTLNEPQYEHEIAYVEQSACLVQTYSSTSGCCEQVSDHTASVPSPPSSSSSSSVQCSPHKQQKMPPPLLQLSPTPPPEGSDNVSNRHHFGHEDHCRHRGHTHQLCTPVLPHNDHHSLVLPTHNVSTSASCNGTTSPMVLVSPASLPCMHTGPAVGGYMFVNPVQLMPSIPSPVAIAVAPVGSEPIPSVATALNTNHKGNCPQATGGNLVNSRPTTVARQLKKTRPTSPVAEQTSPPLKRKKCMIGAATSPEGDGATSGPVQIESSDCCNICSRQHGSHSSTESDHSPNQTSAPFTQAQNIQVVDTLGQFRNTGSKALPKIRLVCYLHMHAV